MRVGGRPAVVAQWQSTGSSSQRCPGFNSQWLLAFSLSSIFASYHLIHLFPAWGKMLSAEFLIIWTIQLFKHPPFPEKMINYCIPSIRTPTFYSNIWTPTPCRAQTGVTERLLAFDSLFGATVRVTKHLPAYYRRFRTSTRLLQSFLNIKIRQSLWSSSGGCQMCTSLWHSLQSSNECCQMCTSLQQSV